MTLDKESMDSVLDRVAGLAKQTIPGVAEASVTLVLSDKAVTAAFTGRLARDLDESQYGRGHGPCLEAAVGAEVREITDAREETRWGDCPRSCVERGSLSSLSVAVPVQETLHGALDLYGVEARAFDDGARELAREFATYAAVAVHDMHLYESTRELAENLGLAMQSRAVIEQAKGVIMVQRRCNAAEAFAILAGLSGWRGTTRMTGHCGRHPPRRPAHRPSPGRAVAGTRRHKTDRSQGLSMNAEGRVSRAFREGASRVNPDVR